MAFVHHAVPGVFIMVRMRHFRLGWHIMVAVMGVRGGFSGLRLMVDMIVKGRVRHDQPFSWRKD
jgi:hypothetical protein